MPSNLPLDDPCQGIPLSNRPMGYWQNMRNLNLRLPDCEERGPPTLFLSDWNPQTGGGLGEVDPVGIRPDGRCSVMEWTGTEWTKVSELTFGEVLGRTGNQWTVVRSFVRFGSQAWICTADGSLVRSTDGGRTWEAHTVHAWSSSDKATYLDKDASGRLWSVQEIFDSSVTSDFGIFVSNNGSGDDWEFIAEIPYFGWMSDGAFWGPAHAISCHPTNPDVVIVAFQTTELHPDFLATRNVYVTTDGGGSWNAIILPEQFAVVVGDDAAEGFFAAGDQGFDANGRFYIAWEVERYQSPFVIGPNNMHYIYVAHTEDYANFTAVNVTPVQETHFGFLQQLYIYGDTLHIVWTQDIDADLSFQGLRTFVSRSQDQGLTWTLLGTFDQPINELTTMPGYPQDLFYDPDTGDIWVFFSMFDDSRSDGEFSALAAVKDYLQYKIPGGSMHAELANISGLPIPRSKYASVTRPWPPI